VIVITFLFYFFILFLVRYFICILPMYLGAPFDFNKFRLLIYIYIYIYIYNCTCNIPAGSHGQ